KNPERLIYTDITGIKHTGILKAPDDWREIPNNSLIVYDEVQYRELFSRHNSKRDKQILDLTTIRKRGIELWLITQRARFLNADVLGLVNEHVHLERVGQKVSNVYIWQEAEMNITKTKKLFAFDKYRWAYPEHIFGFYESIQPDAKHNKRSYLNKGVIGVIVTLIFALIAGAIFIKFAASKGISASGVETKKHDKQLSVQSVPNTKTDVTPASSPVAADLNVECRKGANVEKPECVKWFNDLSKNGSSVAPVQEQVSYNPSKPFDDNIQKSVSYQVTAKPVFSGCTKIGNKYQAYTQQGTKLDVSKSDCERLIKNNDRPFNYFAQPRNETLNQFETVSTDSSKNESTDQTQTKQSDRVHVIDHHPVFSETDITRPSI
ncbi:TPA: hypothetical protein JI285_18475, partial [Acinetobacter baumannii]|nr:hypothetical protein [Acinetobacter baumannii]HAV6123665.1 hypothetical protein [Acinetobacter baumannii]HAV6143016.1 hypothetical protein [Acinetobacter baumannii]HAV6151050.1 hypothetical protein [Acinetobacter baumannii]